MARLAYLDFYGMNEEKAVETYPKLTEAEKGYLFIYFDIKFKIYNFQKMHLCLF